MNWIWCKNLIFYYYLQDDELGLVSGSAWKWQVGCGSEYQAFSAVVLTRKRLCFPLVQSLGGGGSQLGRLKRKPGTLCIVWSTKYFQRTKNKRFYACFFLFFHIWKHSTMKNMTSLILTNVSRGRTRRLWMMFSFTSKTWDFSWYVYFTQTWINEWKIQCCGSMTF